MNKSSVKSNVDSECESSTNLQLSYDTLRSALIQLGGLMVLMDKPSLAYTGNRDIFDSMESAMKGTLQTLNETIPKLEYKHLPISKKLKASNIVILELIDQVRKNENISKVELIERLSRAHDFFSHADIHELGLYPVRFDSACCATI